MYSPKPSHSTLTTERVLRHKFVYEPPTHSTAATMSRFDVDDDSDEDSSGGLSSQLPTEPPFLAYMHDTEAGEQDIRDFFGSELEVISVTVAKNEAKVEFKDRDTLARSLFYGGRLLKGREAKIALSAGDAPPPHLTPPPPPPPPPAPVAENISSFSAQNGNDGGGRGAGAGRGRGGGGRWSSGRESRDAEGRREGGRVGRSGPRSSIFGRDSAPRRPPLSAKHEDGEGGEKEGEAAEGGEKKERPRLQLKPRSKPLGEGGGESGAKPSIFGGGKPHDEVAFEKKWQEKHKDDPKPVLSAGEEDTGEGERGPSGNRYSKRGDRTSRPPGWEEGATGARALTGGSTRMRSGSWGSGRKEGAEGGRGGAGGRGAAGSGRGPTPNKKPTVKKAAIGAEEWKEVEHVTAKKRVEGRSHRGGGEGGEEEDKMTRAVGGAFAALNMDEDSDRD